MQLAIMTTRTSRRAILAGAATLPAIGIPSAVLALNTHSIAFDPVFAAMGSHKAALAKMNADADDCDEATNAHAAIVFDALWDIACTVPTTIAGVRAVLRYEREYNLRNDYDSLFSTDDETLENFHQSIDEALAIMAGESVPQRDGDQDGDKAVRS
jgi:hypothetical protein